ncbi:hypothetical protein ABZ517_16500 [Streptomyces scabiei]|uniref:hypothetical protein n=1 Tax=Streptomyces scabiei TaxID=1930 RepID=UPI0033F05DC2
MTNWLAGMEITAARLADGIDPTVTTTGLTAATGFTVNDFYGVKSGKNVELAMYLQRTGADITATTGNITDTQICTVPAGLRPTATSTITGFWDSGSECGGFVIGTDGICTLRTSTDTINTNANLRLHVSFVQS